jgi:hypothetical protein
MSRRWAVAVCVAIVCAPASASGALTNSPITGNPKGVTLAHEAMRAFAHIPAYDQTEQHFFQIKSDAKTRNFQYMFGVPHHRGYTWASEKATVAVHKNRVVWWLDTLIPTSGHSRWIEIVLNHSGSYWAFGSPRRHSCFRTFATGSTLPYRYGGLGYSIGGRMGAPVKGPTTEQLPYVYRWQAHHTAHETDTIERATKLVVSAGVKITRAGGTSVLAFSFKNTYPQRAPRAPTVNLCRS